MKEFVMNSKEQLGLLFIIISGCFLLFYWTHSAFNSARVNMQSDATAIIDKIAKVDGLMKSAKSKTKNRWVVNGSLLAFIQNETSRFSLDTKMTVLKPKSNVPGKEGATIRFEQFELNEVVTLIGLIDKYENIVIDSVGIVKRFDQPDLVNVSMEISKI